MFTEEEHNKLKNYYSKFCPQGYVPKHLYEQGKVIAGSSFSQGDLYQRFIQT